MKTVDPTQKFLWLPTVSEDVCDYRAGAAQATRTITAASGTIAYDQDGLSLLTQAADNAIASAIQTNKNYLPAAGKSCLYAAKVKVVEAATNAVNVYIGLSSSAAAASLGNDGAGPASSYSGFGFFKVDGSLNWQIEASNGGTQITAELTATNSLDKTAHPAGSSSYQLLEIDVKIKNATKCDVMFKIDGVCVYKLTDYVWTSMVAMGIVESIRAGSTTAETLRVSYSAMSKNA